eukprot:tig00000923_g5470.t1
MRPKEGEAARADASASEPRRFDASTLATDLRQRRQWQKVLYESSDYPDNYTDRSFLASMVTNANVKLYEFGNLVESATVVAQQVSAVFCYVAIFFLYLDEVLETAEVMALEAALLGGGGVLWLAAGAREEAKGDGGGGDGGGGGGGGGWWSGSVVRVVGRQALLAFVLYELSPVLRTLTLTFSDDTIWALTVCLLLAHLLLHDYASAVPQHALVSMNAGMFAAVLLASRLPSDTHVFATTSLSLPLLVFLPLLRHRLRARWRLAHLALTASMAAAAVALWRPLSLFVAGLCVATQLAITLACPAALVCLQRHKRNISGPWDEACPPLD